MKDIQPSSSCLAPGTRVAYIIPIVRIPRAVLASCFGMLPFLLATPSFGANEVQPTNSALSTPLSAKVRVTLPFAQFTTVNPDSGQQSSGVISLLGLSLAGEYREFWTVEVGAVLNLAFDGNEFDYFVRGGLVPVIADWRGADRRGWSVQLDVLAGYRYLHRAEAPDGETGAEVTHGVRANLGFDFVRTFAGSAFTARILYGVTLPISQERTGSWKPGGLIMPTENLRWATDLGIDLGFAF